MKKQVILKSLAILFMFVALELRAQVGINTDGSQPDPSAMLDVKSAIKGFLPPRVALTSLIVSSPVSSPVATGLLVFNTATSGTAPNNVVPGYYYWSGAKWVTVSTPLGVNPGEMLYWNGSAWVLIPAGSHGQQLYFCDGQPTWGGCHALLMTTSVSGIMPTGAVSGGNITSDGGSPVLEKGVCWSTLPNPTYADNKTSDGGGNGIFTSNITGLTPNTQYYLRAYARNLNGIGYGNEVNFMSGAFADAPVTKIPVLYACPGASVDIPVTVYGFTNIGFISLQLQYSSAVLTYTGATNTSGFTGMTFNGSVPGVVNVSAPATTGFTYPDNTLLFTLHFTYSGGTSDLIFFDNGPSCEYHDGNLNLLNDLPTSAFYIAGKVNEIAAVGTPVFTAGATSSRCQGAESVTYTATAANSTSLAYSLDANSLAAGNSINLNTGTVNFSASWSGTSVITATAGGCAGPKTAIHTVTVNPLLPVSISVTPSANPVCAGTSVLFSAVAVHGGTAPSYQWKVNGINAGTNSATYSYTPFSGDVVTCVLTSNLSCVSGNPSTSSPVNMTVNPLLPVSVSIVPSGNSVCAGTSVTFTATAINGGSTPLYQWKVNGINAGSNNAAFTYVPVHNDAVICLVTSNATCASGNPATSNTVTMVVNPLLPVSVTIVPSANNVCAGTTVTCTATPVNGGTLPAYQWKVNGIAAGTNSATYSYVPLNNDIVTCVLTSNSTCVSGNPATSNAVTMTINPLLPVSVTISASANPVCSGSQVTYTAIPVNGGSTPSYQWKVNGIVAGTNSSTYSYVPLHNDIVTCIVTSNATCVSGNPATSNAITMTVNAKLPVSVSIVSSANPVCAGTSVTYTATPVNGGTTPSYQWKVNNINSGTNSATYSYTPASNDVITCVLTSNGTCVSGNPATSNAITMIVNPLLPVSISIAASANPVCFGTAAVFTATPVNGGTSPVYQWQVNGIDIGTGGATFTYNPVTNDVVTCKLTSNATCATGNPATSNAVTMIVNPLLPVSVSITASANPVCGGTQVIYTAAGVNGGAAPSYQWKVNGTDAGTNNAVFTYVPVNNDVVKCILTSNATCVSGNPATSNEIIMNVNLQLAVGSVSANQTICTNLTPAKLTGVPPSNGTSPVYQWQSSVDNNSFSNIDGATVLDYQPGQLTGTTYYRQMQNATGPCGGPLPTNTVTISVNQHVPADVDIAANPSGTVCPSTNVIFTATPVNGGTSPSYQWKVNGINSGTNSTTFVYAPVNGDQVKCIMTSNLTCVTDNPASSDILTMSVGTNPNLQAGVSITANPSGAVCAGTAVAYTATPVNGGISPVYQWKVNGIIAGTNSSTFSYAPANNDAVVCILTSDIPCVTGNPATSNTMLMSINAKLPVSVSIAASANPVCAGTSVTYTATAVNGGTNPVFQWKVNGVNAGTGSVTYTYVPVTADVVTCVLTSSETCVSGNPATSNSITMTVNQILPVSVNISSNPSGAVCQGTSVTFTAVPTNGGSSPAYQWLVNGSNVGSNSATYSYVPSQSDVVTCVLTSTLSCVSGNPATSNAITMIVNQSVAVSVTIAASANPVVPGTSVTFTATAVNGGTSPVYQWKVNGTVVGTNSSVYTYTPVNNDNVLCILTSSIATCVTGSPATSNTIVMNVMYGIPCPDAPTVTYGGQTYNTVLIGTQCWFRENLNIGTMVNGSSEQTSNGIVEKYCYNNDAANCNVYGGLYQWAEMVQYYNGASNTANWSPVPTGNVQGICPSGWHLPTNDEYWVLYNFQGGQSVVGGKIKEAGTAHFVSPNVGATNSSGFTALPGGLRWSSGVYYYLTQNTELWTISAGANPATDVYYIGASYLTTLGNNGQFYKVTGLSVRCLKN